MKTGTTSLKRLLASYPEKVRDLALQTRRLILDSIPRIEETVDPSARVIGYGLGPGYRGLICTVILSRSGVKLGFYRGVDLPDPQGLLEGAGKVHRHVQLSAPADLKKPGLKSLLKAAHAAWEHRNS